MNIGEAIQAMKDGQRVCREGWNGKGIHISMQIPDENSKMSSPYIYIDTTGLDTKNDNAPKSLVPWAPSQTDLLADDWQVFKAPVTDATIADIREQLNAAVTDDQKMLAMGIAETLGIDLESPNEV